MKGNADFHDTYIDIIAAAHIDLFHGSDTTEHRRWLQILHQITQGRVTVADGCYFYLKPGSQAWIELNLVAERIRNIALAPGQEWYP
jgi:hypothetical protein